MLKKAKLFLAGAVLTAQVSCGDYRRNDYVDNSPTSGQLNVYYDEGLETHVKNQVLTFESQYELAHINLHVSNDEEAVMALYNDSCKAIVISRLLNEKEKTMFAARQYTPNYTMVAYSGVTLLTNVQTPISALSKHALKDLLLGQTFVSDSAGNKIELKVVIDRNNSSVMRYLIDSIMGKSSFGANCSSMGSTPETIDYITAHPGVIGIVDFAWLSDRDDRLYRTTMKSIRILSVSERYNEEALPNQSTFKLKTYPLMRPVYVMRNDGEFSLAKGFESFVSGPKGQMTILKQGLLPARQPGRSVEIKIE
jgi:phosphate transport system substrate-binding protein